MGEEHHVGPDHVTHVTEVTSSFEIPDLKDWWLLPQLCGGNLAGQIRRDKAWSLPWANVIKGPHPDYV
jgi:hypothetical protein